MVTAANLADGGVLVPSVRVGGGLFVKKMDSFSSSSSGQYDL